MPLFYCTISKVSSIFLQHLVVLYSGVSSAPFWGEWANELFSAPISWKRCDGIAYVQSY